MSNPTHSFDADKLINWSFADEPRPYSADDAIRYAKGFAAGLGGEMAESDKRFLDPAQNLALPVIAVPLADSEFWEQKPETGIVWQQMVHASEAITIHKPLPLAANLILKKQIQKIYDRGAERGAVMLTQCNLVDGDTPYITLDVTTVLRGNGGFGGEPDNRPRQRWVPEDRPADAYVELKSPTADNPLFELKVELSVAEGSDATQLPLRGVCSFGLAGRAALHLVCNNQPEKLRYLEVRYAGMLYTGETIGVELWHLETGRAAMRVKALERDQLVLGQCLVEFDAD